MRGGKNPNKNVQIKPKVFLNAVVGPYNKCNRPQLGCLNLENCKRPT